jgi:hypothetical protein
MAGKPVLIQGIGVVVDLTWLTGADWSRLGRKFWMAQFLIWLLEEDCSHRVRSDCMPRLLNWLVRSLDMCVGTIDLFYQPPWLPTKKTHCRFVLKLDA